ncbi:uncharacterized protein [Halyomorpha halys]|uniref:uncharacterized protein n=1 Tax=Halyomorpha halys TaxID=286706 RepID=UPI0034D1CD8C
MNPKHALERAGAVCKEIVQRLAKTQAIDSPEVAQTGQYSNLPFELNNISGCEDGPPSQVLHPPLPENENCKKAVLQTDPPPHIISALSAALTAIMFPVIHFTEDKNSLKKRLSDEYLLENEYLLHQGVYREVRNICPEGDILTIDTVLPQHVGYILLGFKSIDRNFSQVMVDSWKDWTGARYIYMYLPDELGLSRISFYTREAPDSLNMFMYLVLVECRGVTTRERQMKLLDFAQRMRVERMSGYISVYGISQE